MTDGPLLPVDLSRLADPERLAALRVTALLDSPPEDAFDRLTRLAARVLGVPAAMVTLIDESREFWKSCAGVTGPGLEARESALERSFCKYVVASAEPLVVVDTREHPVLKDNPAVTEGGVVAYAGMPLVSREGHALGSLCAIDFQPRTWSEHDLAVLSDLAAAVMTEIEVRITAALAEKERSERAALLDSALEGIYGMDWEGRCTFINRAGAEMLGYRPEELLGRNMHEAVHHTRSNGTPHPAAECPIMRGCLTGECFRTDEDVFWCEDGASIPVEYACAPLIQAGEQVGGVVTFRNITEHKRAVLALRESEARYRSIFQGAAEGFFLVARDEDGAFRYVDANPAMEQITGITREQAVGSRPDEILPPEAAARITALFARVFETGEVVEVEHTNPLPRGQVTTRTRFCPLRDPAGQVVRVLGIVEDVTERRHAEQAIRHSENRFRAVFSRAATGIALVNAEGQVVDVNPALAEMLGRSVPELQAMSVYQVTHPDDLELDRGLFEEMLRGERSSYEIEKRYIHKDGSTVWGRLGVSLLGGGTDSPSLALGIVTNISERRQMEERLRQASKMEAVGRLAGGVAHDFNNLLTAILGNTELVLADMPEGHPSREDLREVCRAAERAAELTRQMLAFSRQQVIQPRLLYLNGVVSGMQRMLSRMLGADIELVVHEGEGPLGPVMADPTQIEQVLLNLAVNARDAMPGGGVLMIRTEDARLTAADRARDSDVVPGDYVLLEVGDTGGGIKPQVLEHIFEPFFTTKEVGKGTGLGLAMVYGIVKQAGGYIWPESRPGKGTRFRIYLPRIEQTAARGERAGVAEPEVQKRRLGTVLLVEDEHVVRRFAARVLQQAGYTVFEAASGEEALHLLAEQREPVDLLLTDLVMPGAGGREISEVVRRHYPKIPVLFMSGYTADDVVRRGILDDGVAFVQKPFTPTELAKRVREVLEAQGGGVDKPA